MQQRRRREQAQPDGAVIGRGPRADARPPPGERPRRTTSRAGIRSRRRAASHPTRPSPLAGRRSDDREDQHGAAMTLIARPRASSTTPRRPGTRGTPRRPATGPSRPGPPRRRRAWRRRAGRRGRSGSSAGRRRRPRRPAAPRAGRPGDARGRRSPRPRPPSPSPRAAAPAASSPRPVARRSGDDPAFVQRGLDQEVVRRRRRVQPRAEQPRAPLEVAGHHRRRDLPAHVVLDDRLVQADGPDQERRRQHQRRRPGAPARSRPAAPRCPPRRPCPAPFPNSFVISTRRPGRDAVAPGSAPPVKKRFAIAAGSCHDVATSHFRVIRQGHASSGLPIVRLRSLRAITSRREPYAGA